MTLKIKCIKPERMDSNFTNIYIYNSDRTSTIYIYTLYYKKVIHIV